jgi:dTDP-4-amino-4,6-dideoxygalactose transaminase
MNAKISEYHAAVGLASLDSWSEDRGHWARARDLAIQASKQCGLATQPSFMNDYVTSTWNVRLPENISLASVMDSMASKGVATRSWWPAGVNAMPAFAQQTIEPLDNTEALVSSVLGLPFSRTLSEADFIRVTQSLVESFDISGDTPSGKDYKLMSTM